MLKHQEILEKLTTEQKLELLADFNALGDLAESEYGVKFVKAINTFEHQVAKDYPRPESLINSFDDELFGQIADDIATKVKMEGVTLISLPSTSVKGSIYANGYTEDPNLATSFVMQFANTAERTGVKTYVIQPHLTDDAVKVSDLKYNARAVNEFFLRPIHELLKKVDIVMPKEKNCAKNYSKANEILDLQINNKCDIIIDSANQEETLTHACQKDAFVAKGSLSVLKEAYERYKNFWQAYEDGEIALSDVETACRSGNALSPDMIDEAVERIIDFSIKLRAGIKENLPSYNNENLPLKATEESIVLLKNEQVLPLKKSKVLLVGELADYSENGEQTLNQVVCNTENKLNIIGYSKGYEGYKIIDKNLIDDAVMKARHTDVVVVALGEDFAFAENSRKGNNSNLPANQIALLEALSKVGKKIVGVVYGMYPDMRFDEYCDAVLLAPIGCKYSAQALFNVLTGEVSPSGRLANTCYENADEFAKNLRNYKNAGRNKVGTFYGYRYYDTAGIKVKYPFGFGLSYSQFIYSKLNINDKEISFYLKNKGKQVATEVVQLYVGKKVSSLIRPKKELKFFKKVVLQPGQITKVVIARNDFDFTVYDKETEQMVAEIGSYEIYVGSSVSDVKLTGKLLLGGAILKKDGRKSSEYFQTISNIHDKKYYLDLPVNSPKKSFEKLRNFMYVLSGVMTCLAVIYLYLNYVGWLPKILAIHLTVAGLTVLPIVISVFLTIKKIKFINKQMEDNRNMKKENREKLNIEELENAMPYETLFLEEFMEDEVKFVEEDEKEELIEEKETKVQIFDSQFTLNVACTELINFALSKELILDPVCTRSLLSAFASSRLIVVHYDERYIFDKFIEILGQYLGNEITADDFDAVKNCGGDILTFKTEFSSLISLTNIATTLTNNSIDDERIKIMSINNVRSKYLKPYLTHVLKYLDSPEKQTQIHLHSDNMDQQFDLPSNVWFIITMAEGEKITEIPKFILDNICVVDLAAWEPKEVADRRIAMQQELVEQMAENQEPVIEESLSEITEEVVADENVISQEQPETIEQTEENVQAEEVQAEELESEVVAEQVPTEVVEEQAIEEIASQEIVEEPILEEQVIEEPVVEEQVLEEVVADEIAVEEQNENIEGTIEVTDQVGKLTFYQFNKLVSNAVRDCLLEENLWKRVDKLEDYVCSKETYRIDNKHWHRIEKYVSSYIATGGLPEEALDSVVAHHMIYGMLPIIENNKDKNDDKFTHVIENIFGEGHAPYSIKVVKSTGMDV